MAKQRDTYEIGIWVTKNHYDYADYYYSDGYKARDVAAQWIKDSFNISPHSVSIIKGDEVIKTPDTYDYYESEFCGDPCWTSSEICWYNSLEYWVQLYSSQPNCKVDLKSAADIRILLGNDGDLSGLSSSRFVVTNAGSNLLQLSSSGYERFTNNQDAEGIKTILHQIGHSLLEDTLPQKDEYPGNDHDMGEVVHNKKNGLYHKYYISPMGIVGDDNNCGEMISGNYHAKGNVPEDGDGNKTHWSLRLSSCCQDYFRSSYY